MMNANTFQTITHTLGGRKALWCGATVQNKFAPINTPKVPEGDGYA